MRPESTSVVLRADLQALAQEFDAETAALRFIGKRVAPIFESAVADGQYPIMNRETFKKPVNTNRAEDGSYNRIVGEFGSGSYNCEDHGLEYRIDDRRRRRYARFFDAEKAATRILRYQMLMSHERRVAAAYAAGGFTNTNVATAWTTTATAAPLDDIATGINAICDACGCAQEELSIIIPRVDFTEMLQTTQVIDKLKYTYPGIQPALLRPAQVASMLQIKQVIIASGAYDTTEEGIAETMAMIWTAGVMYIALFCEEKEDLEVPSAARTIVWTADAPELPVVESFREDKTRSDIVRMRDDTDEVMIGEADLFVYKLTNT